MECIAGRNAIFSNKLSVDSKHINKGKERADEVSIRIYGKNWESLHLPYSKYRALAVALDEAIIEIEDLKNQLLESKSE